MIDFTPIGEVKSITISGKKTRLLLKLESCVLDIVDVKVGRVYINFLENFINHISYKITKRLNFLIDITPFYGTALS